MAPHGVGKTGWDDQGEREWVWRTPDAVVCTKGHALVGPQTALAAGVTCPGCHMGMSAVYYCAICSGKEMYGRCVACITAAKKRHIAGQVVKYTILHVFEHYPQRTWDAPTHMMLALALARSNDILLRHHVDPFLVSPTYIQAVFFQLMEENQLTQLIARDDTKKLAEMWQERTMGTELT
jgi:hypothetical protein